MRIIFVRHGELDYENDCLTEAGRRQAKAAERLLSENISEIYSSPLGRAAETAGYASELLNLPVKTLDFMRELKWGSRDGTPVFANGHPWDIADEMSRKGMDLNRLDWRAAEYFRTNRVVDCVDRVALGIDGWLKSLGYVRSGYTYEHLEEEESVRTVALFSHGGSSSAAIAHILNVSFPYACALLHSGFAGMIILRLSRRKGPIPLPCLELVSDTKDGL